MSKKDIGNFNESIHTDNYEAPYYQKQVGAESLIFERGRSRVSLCGDWQFGVDQYDTCLRQRWFEEVYADGDGRPFPLDFKFDEWETIPVPACWNLQRSERLQRDLFLYEGSCVYTREFVYDAAGIKDSSKALYSERLGNMRCRRAKNTVPLNCPDGCSERTFLRFGAANTACMVFLNKQYLGMHIGGYTPFCFEVTDILQEQNRLVVVVNNARKRTGVPTDNTDWFNYGGLFREVSLIRVPETFIRDFQISLVPDGAFMNIKCKLKIDGPEQNGTALLIIPELDTCIEVKIKNGICANKKKTTLRKKPQLWSPDNPHLYDVTVSYGEDAITERVGFREVKVKDGKILLNGSEVFLKGVCAHEESVPNGNAVTEAEIRENFALAKEMGCNFMRLAHYPHAEAAARIADEVGIMLWEEIPVYWAIAFDNADTYKNAENQLSELIIRDRNRASVIIWSVGNENADSDARLSFMSRLAARARKLDKTRLISAACLVDGGELKIKDRLAEQLDVIGINEYYGWYEPDFSKLPKIFENSRPSKPIVITEFGADARSEVTGEEGQLYTEANQKAVYEKQLAVLGGIPYVKGICPWIFYDFRCPRRLHPMQNYYNIKGLLSADKKHKKPAFDVMREFYQCTITFSSFL